MEKDAAKKDDRTDRDRRTVGPDIAELARTLALQDAQIHEMLKRT